jgi:hypothetical protein
MPVAVVTTMDPAAIRKAKEVDNRTRVWRKTALRKRAGVLEPYRPEREILGDAVQPNKASSKDARLPDRRAIVAATTLQSRAISSLLASSARLSAME